MEEVGSHFERAQVLESQERFREALQECDLALLEEPSNAQAHNLRGIVLEQLHRAAEALNAYEKAVQLSPSFQDARMNYEDLKAELNNVATSKAITASKRWLQDRVDQLWFQVNFGKSTDKMLLLLRTWLVALVIVWFLLGIVHGFWILLPGAFVIALMFPLSLGAPLTILFPEAQGIDLLLIALFPVGWLLYAVLTVITVFNRSVRTSRVFYTLYVALLIVNVVGWIFVLIRQRWV